MMELSGEVLQFLAIGLNALVILIVIPIRAAITKLQESDDRLVERVQRLEVEVAKNYVQRAELANAVSTIVAKLERIEQRLFDRVDALDHQKADR